MKITDKHNEISKDPDLTFIPKNMASWWCTIEDLQWSQKQIVHKIKRRAAAFAEARIDTAINFGFHVRFDFSNYFGQLHNYYSNVCEELHKYDIKFMDHYSCNHVERPRGEAELESYIKTIVTVSYCSMIRLPLSMPNMKDTFLGISAKLMYAMEAGATRQRINLRYSATTTRTFWTCIKNICKG